MEYVLQVTVQVLNAVFHGPLAGQQYQITAEDAVGTGQDQDQRQEGEQQEEQGDPAGEPGAVRKEPEGTQENSLAAQCQWNRMENDEEHKTVQAGDPAGSGP